MSKKDTKQSVVYRPSNRPQPNRSTYVTFTGEDRPCHPYNRKVILDAKTGKHIALFWHEYWEVEQVDGKWLVTGFTPLYSEEIFQARQ